MFVLNFNTTLAESGTLEADAKFQYLCTLFRREYLHQYELLSAEVESMETLNVHYIIRGLAQFSFSVNLLSKQKRAMRRGIKIAQSYFKTLCGAFD